MRRDLPAPGSSSGPASALWVARGRVGPPTLALLCSLRQTFGRVVRAALYAPKEPMLDYNMVIIFIMAVGTVALGGYWAGSRDVRK